jgi:hypothetical protein
MIDELEEKSMKPEDAFSRDPVIMAALALHGMDIAALPWEPEEMSTLDCVRSDPPGLPSLILDSEACGSVRWYAPRPGTTVAYEIDATGPLVRLEDVALADTALTLLEGRPLRELVSIPGGDALTIRSGSVHRHSTGASTCLRLDPPTGGETR